MPVMAKKEPNPYVQKMQSDIPVELHEEFHEVVAKLRREPYIRNRRGKISIGPMTNALVAWFVKKEPKERSAIAIEALELYDKLARELRMARGGSALEEDEPAVTVGSPVSPAPSRPKRKSQR